MKVFLVHPDKCATAGQIVTFKKYLKKLESSESIEVHTTKDNMHDKGSLYLYCSTIRYLISTCDEVHVIYGDDKLLHFLLGIAFTYNTPLRLIKPGTKDTGQFMEMLLEWETLTLS